MKEFPESWKNGRKNVQYSEIEPHVLRRLLEDVVVAEHHSPQALRALRFERDLPPYVNSSFVLLEWQRAMHKKVGAQMVIQKSVSDDLWGSDLEEINFMDVPWPRDSLEFFFEDPAIPSCLMQRMHVNTNGYIIEDKRKVIDSVEFGVTDDPERSVRIRITQPIADNRHLDCFIGAEEMNAYATQDLTPAFNKTAESELVVPIDPEGRKGLQSLVLLCYKVLVYSAVPQLKPKEMLNKQRLPREAKPGCKNRPKVPVLHVVDLPAAYRRDCMVKIGGGGNKEFRGRRGHFHYYRADCFVNRKGTFDYFPPVLGRDGTLPKRVFRVRKLQEQQPEQ